MDKIKIVYLTGFWYSGATILGRSLKTSDQVTYVGEIRDFWVKGLKQDEKCSCGKNFSTCEFWQRVKREYEKSFPSESIEAITEELKKFERWPNYFKLKKYLKNKNDKSYHQFLETYLKHTERLYEIIAKESGKNIIVDTSRLAVRLLAISLSKKLELCPIYIIRDPRGVVNSLFKKEIRDYGKRKNSFFSHTFKWIVKNSLTLNAMKNINVNKKIYIWYKYFTKNPAKVLGSLEKVINCKIDYIVEEGIVSLNLKAGHVFTGNRSRFNTGKISIREDTKWKNELQLIYKTLISVFSLPMFKYILARFKGQLRRREDK